MEAPLWQPSTQQIRDAQMTAFANGLAERCGRDLSRYQDLHRFSIDSPGAFWEAIWEFCEVIGEGPGPARVAADRAMPGARFFPEARLNFAENLLRDSRNESALIAWDEQGKRTELSRRALRSRVAALAHAFREFGLLPGDRVGAIISNGPEAIIAMLATTCVGAIWSSCSPDFGTRGVVDRFGQIEPRILIAVETTRYGGKRFDVRERIPEILAELPSVEHVISITPDGAPQIPNAHAFESLAASKEERELAFPRFPFDHPIAILYSSGTTGKPKCIVHGAGGTLLQHLKEQRLHLDLRTGERFFYYTTCGWMMWNWLVSGLASGATLVLYDGSPFHPDAARLFQLIEREGVHVMGISAKFIDAVAKTGLEPMRTFDLSNLRCILSTGSPLMAEGFDFIYEHVNRNVQLASISGGTDIVSCFVLGNPLLPVWRGEIQSAGLGMAVDVFDEQGAPLLEDQGELVCTHPFPSMPVGFWNDPDGSRYREAYFERFAGVWCHGDWIRRTEHDGFVILGRSDTVLNPGGVRIGTAEIYREVEKLSEVLEGLAIGQDWHGDIRIVLFVRLREGVELDDELCSRIRDTIRRNASPRHVPARIARVADLPRTRSGKISELAVREIVHGRPARNVEALANPEALEYFRDRAELAR